MLHMKKKNVLIIGSGGREHALGWKIKQSSKVGKIYFAPGNAGTAQLGENIPIDVLDIDALLTFAIDKKVSLTIVGPDDVLAAGIVNVFQEKGLAIFGPTREAAQIEASKAFAKQLMKEEGIPTASFATFSRVAEARNYLKEHTMPVVIKASGLALGKGVIIARTFGEAEQAIDELMVKKTFGKAGDEIVIEEFLEGKEISVHAFCDGETVVLFPLARDHKPIFDGNNGPNTGGMGTISPLDDIPLELLIQIEKTIVKPALRGLQKRGIQFTGCLYPGLILTKQGPKVLEFNARFGDPETQTYMRLLQTDLFDIMLACVEKRLSQQSVKWTKNFACCIVVASAGYPGVYKKGVKVTGLSKVKKQTNIVVFHAGTKKISRATVTTGGRVLGVTGRGKTLDAALRKAYAAIGKQGISFAGMHYRSDIGAVKNGKIINGMLLAAKREKKLKQALDNLKHKPHVVSILIGNDPPSVLYTHMKQKKAAEIGINFQPIFLPDTVSYQEIVDTVQTFNRDTKIMGIMFQLPFPKKFLIANPDANQLIQLIRPEKDMDGLTQKRRVLPGAVQASISILHDEKISVHGKNVVVLGVSELVGKPAANAMEQLGAYVEVCNSKTKDLAEKTRKADIIICATGVPGLLTGTMISEGVIVIDIGAEKVDGKVVGDVDFGSVVQKAAKITPVPGGVGPMTVISLMENIYTLINKKKL